MWNESSSVGNLVAHFVVAGPHGIGDLGPAAYEFVDFLERAGQSLWQVLPIGPVGYRGTPYQARRRSPATTCSSISRN